MSENRRTAGTNHGMNREGQRRHTTELIGINRQSSLPEIMCGDKAFGKSNI